jgi:hypothetical protein
MKPRAWLALSDGMISVTLVSEAGFDAAPLLVLLALEEPELLQAPTAKASAAATTPPARAGRRMPDFLVRAMSHPP